jgi:uncharacterized protein (DUF2267 family)
MDTVAQRLAAKAHSLRGILTDTPYPEWEEATESQREFWREIARASQDKPDVAKAAVRKAKL